jgi:hypothetical protein
MSWKPTRTGLARRRSHFPPHGQSGTDTPDKPEFGQGNYTTIDLPKHQADFDAMTPFRARRRADGDARAKTRNGCLRCRRRISTRATRQPYKNTTALVRIAHGRDRSRSGGTDQPALQVLGSCVDLLKQWQDHFTGCLSRD